MDPGKLGAFLPNVWTSSSRIHLYKYVEISGVTSLLEGYPRSTTPLTRDGGTSLRCLQHGAKEVQMSNLRITIVSQHPSFTCSQSQVQSLTTSVALYNASRPTKPPIPNPLPHLPRLANPSCYPNRLHQRPSHAISRRDSTSLPSRRILNSKTSLKLTLPYFRRSNASTPRPSSQIQKRGQGDAGSIEVASEVAGHEGEVEEEVVLVASMTEKQDGRRRKAMQMGCAC
jgi:hypothetical protein